MTEIVETARAKINLALHVTGQRADGYHTLESIVAFAGIGDRLTVRKAAVDSFTSAGPFAAGLPDGPGNLVLRARDLWRDALCLPDAVAIHLDKNLPISSGIGGGSADAAACLRAMNRLWEMPSDNRRLMELGTRLGADVPMCIASRSVFASGIGERLAPINLPGFPLVLVNPLVEVSTPEIFSRLRTKQNPPIDLPEADTPDAWLAGLAGLRNDLQTPAEAHQPVIANIRQMLTDHGALLSRMSGSGATCFGIFTDLDTATRAADDMGRTAPDWFVAVTSTAPRQESEGNQHERHR